MNDQSFDPSKLVLTNGLTQGYQRKPRHLIVKSLVTVVSVSTVGYLAIGYLV